MQHTAGVSICMITRDTLEENGQYTPNICLDTTAMVPCAVSMLKSVTEGHCGASALDGKGEAGTCRRTVSGEEVQKSHVRRKKARRKASSYKRKRKSCALAKEMRSTRKKRVGAIEARKVAGARICDPKTPAPVCAKDRERVLKVRIKSESANAFHFYDSRTFQGACVDTGAQNSVTGLRQARAYCKKTGNKTQKWYICGFDCMQSV